MRRESMIIIILAALTVASIEPLCGQDTAGSQEQATLRAKKASGELLATLRGMLGKALAAGGPVGATAICADSAQVVGARLAASHGLSIRRVSERWRNPKDAPDDFEIGELARFATLLASGTKPDSIESVCVTDGASVKVLRYMKPIMVGEMCLNCHGSRLKPAIDEVLQLQYPDDRAVGYTAGDLRGAVSVTVPLGAAK
jgi:hypothetical protein